MPTKKMLIDQTGALLPEVREEIKKYASRVECECPSYLMKIIESIEAFQYYETNCLLTDLKQKEIHEWLLKKSYEMELLCSSVIVDLMKMEGFIDENNNFTKVPVLDENNS